MRTALPSGKGRRNVRSGTGRELGQRRTGHTRADAAPAFFVVNGSDEFLDVVRELLQDENYNVTTTNFVPRTFHQIETARPSVLVVDLCHGEQAGWDLLTELR